MDSVIKLHVLGRHSARWGTYEFADVDTAYAHVWAQQDEGHQFAYVMVEPCGTIHDIAILGDANMEVHYARHPYKESK